MNQAMESIKTLVTPYADKANVWWQSRLPREQWVIKLLAATIIFFLCYMLIWQPMLNARNNARSQYVAANQTYQWLQANEKTVKALQGNGSNSQNSDWVMNINQSAQTHQLALKGFTPQGKKKVSVVLDKQSFSKLIGWLASLRSQGILATNMVLSDTSAPGRVNAQITLESE